jgi:hypothetical protein
MKRLSIELSTLLVTGALAGCGSLPSLSSHQTTEKDGTSPSDASKKDSVALTDAADAEETSATTAGTATTGETTDDSASEADAPAWLQAVHAAQVYTFKLLGLDAVDALLKDYKATVEAAKALATDVADFKAKVEPAREALDTALADVKTKAEQAKKDHADELDKLFVATKAVFAACASDIEFRPCKGQGPGKSMIGNGEFDGRMHDRRPPPPPRRGRGPGRPGGEGGFGDEGPGLGWGLDDDATTTTSTDSASSSSTTSAEETSDACKAATDALTALIPAS